MKRARLVCAHPRLLLMVFAIGLAACDDRSLPGPTPPSPGPADAPTLRVTAIAPSTGSNARPTSVTISGTGFLAGATVAVDVTVLTARVVNSTTITAIAPARAAGPVDVVVTNPGGSARD